MLMIVMWHICIHGNLQQNVADGGAKQIILRMIFALTVIGTNLYVLLTGYFQSRSSFKFGKLLRLWGTVLLYSLGFGALYCLVTHRLPANPVRILFPVISREYWFVTVWVVLYMLSPFLNRMLNFLSNRELLSLLVVLFVINSVCPTLLPKNMALNPMDGHDISWFVTLYLSGAFLRRWDFGQTLKQRYIVFAYLFLIFLLFAVPRIADVLLTRYHIASGIPAKLSMQYNSPLVYACSIACFMMFKGFRVDSLFIYKISILTFGIYLIHDNPIVRDMLFRSFLKDRFGRMSMGCGSFALAIAGTAVVIFICAALLEFFRKFLFDYIRPIRQAR